MRKIRGLLHLAILFQMMPPLLICLWAAAAVVGGIAVPVLVAAVVEAVAL